MASINTKVKNFISYLEALHGCDHLSILTKIYAAELRLPPQQRLRRLDELDGSFDRTQKTTRHAPRAARDVASPAGG
jgi:hypothetical protein